MQKAPLNIKLDLRATSSKLESSRKDSELLLSDGRVSKDTMTAEKGVMVVPSGAGLTGISRKFSIHSQQGASLVEALLAVAVFGLLVTAVTGAIIYAGQSTLLGGQRARAAHIAKEGSEAMRAIRDENFSLLTPGTYGLAISGNKWTLAGAPDTVDGLYTRTITITSPDAVTRSIDISVAWQQNPQRTGTITMTSKLTNWRVASVTTDNGILVYGDGVTAPTTTPRTRGYTDSTNIFSTEAQTITGALGRNFVVRTSPTKREAIAGYTDATGTLRVLCYNGTSWSQDWSVSIGGTGTTKRFDIAYETSSGDAIVLYSTNAATNELAYRTKPGASACGTTNWSAATVFDSPGTTGIVQWVKVAWDKRSASNNIAAIWADANRDLQAAVWSGTAWTQRTTALEISLEIVTTAQDVDDFDVEYESLSGDVVVVWANSLGANGTNGSRYSNCVGGTSACTWSAATAIPLLADDATNLDLASNPNTDQMLFASIGNGGSDLQEQQWNGTAWLASCTGCANRYVASGTPLAGTKLVTVGWLINGATTRGIVIYNDSASTAVNYWTYSGTNFGVQTDWVPTPLFATAQKWYTIEADPKNKDRLLFALSDANNDLFAKRLVMSATPAFTWSNADGGAALETTLGQATSQPFDFAFWRNP